MLTDRNSALRLYDQARCQGIVSLFSSADREDYSKAAALCVKCPVADLCYSHVDPEVGYTGTVAGRLYYDGVDVTDAPDVLPPPVYRESDVEPDLVVEIDVAFLAEDVDWSVYNDSTLMAAVWRLRKSGYRASRIARVSGFTKERIIQLTDHFEEESSADLKDFIRDAEVQL